jgi:hypothetical protein
LADISYETGLKVRSNEFEKKSIRKTGFAGGFSLPSFDYRGNPHIIDQERSSSAKLSEIILKDPNLTARILRIANSPYYGSR